MGDLGARVCVYVCRKSGFQRLYPIRNKTDKNFSQPNSADTDDAQIMLASDEIPLDHEGTTCIRK